MSTFDLFILPLVRSGGQEKTEIQGLYVAAPPRRPARGRDRDQLALYLNLSRDPGSPEQLNALLADFAKVYYRTAGTATTALKAVAEAANQHLLDSNLRSAGAGNQVVGSLTQAVLREDHVFLAQSGPAHAFVITQEGVQHYFDLQLSGRGLGLTRTTNIRFSQVDLKANNALVLTADPPARWTSAMLQGSQGQGPESVRRRLLSQSGPELNAVLLQAQPGPGQLRLLKPAQPQRPQVSTPPAVQAPPTPSRPEPAAASLNIESEEIKPAFSPGAGELHWDEPLDEEIEQVTVSLRREDYPMQEDFPPPPPLISRPTPAEQTRRKPGPDLSFIGTAFKSAGRASARVFAGLLSAFATIARRMLPDESLFTLPASTMAFIAVAIPLVVVAVSSAVYFQRGRAAQYEVYFLQAQEAAVSVQEEEGPEALRQGWEATLQLLDQAEAFQKTSESAALRSQVQAALDRLDYVDRLEFQPALVDNLKETAHITRMVANDTDLYMLNAREGVVLRAIFTNTGYRLDPTFQCGPGPQGGVIVGSIKDIAAIPKGNEFEATILGIDANGNLLYCIPGNAPLAVPMTPPDIQWGTPEALTFDTDDLYILDPSSNAVWIFRRMSVTEEPRLFFGDQVPPMQDVIDMAVNLNDLYLLHTDGHLTTCAYSGLVESPTRCQEPAEFADPRPGRANGPLLEGAYFTEIYFAPPPDPSLYLLEPNSHAIYHLSVRLTFQRQFRPSKPLPEGPATAFAISRGNRTVFMAIGNQVFYASMP